MAFFRPFPVLRRNLPGHASCLRAYSTSPAVGSAPYRILFCGTDAFAKTIVTALHASIDVCSSISVLTARGANDGWKSKKRVTESPVKKWAKVSGVEYGTVPSAGIDAWKPFPAFESMEARNILITASFGHLISQTLLDRFPASQRLNLHPSLLPQLRGAAPIQWAIARQMETTGVTVQTLGESFDSGSIYAQDEVPIRPEATYESLETELAKQGSQLLLRVLKDLPSFAANSWPQSHAPKHLLPSRAPKLERTASAIRWNEWSSSDILARHRGFGYLHPLWTSMTGSTEVTLLDVEALSPDYIDKLKLPRALLKKEQSAGAAVYWPATKSVIVRCKDGLSYLSVKSLQSAGKREMVALRWIVGYRDRYDKDSLLYFQ